MLLPVKYDTSVRENSKKYPICIIIEMLEPENQRLYLPETVTSETDACSRPLQSACQGKSDVSTSLISVISSC